MPDSPVISGVADLPKFYFAEGAPFRMTLNIDSDFSMSGKFVAFRMRERDGKVRRIFGTDSGESNLTISSQVITANIATDDETVPAFSGGWTLADVQSKGGVEYWFDITASEGSDVLLRLQGQADWVKAGSDIVASNAVVASPSIDVEIVSGAVSVSVAVSGGGSSMTAAEILTAIKAVDGTGSGLDADLLDGNHASAFATSAQGTAADAAKAKTDFLTVTQSVDLDAIESASHAAATIGASLTDVLTLTGQAASATDLGADKIWFWDDSANKVTGLSIGDNLTISGTTIAASGGASITGTGFNYVRAGGNDSTGVNGDPSKPFATMQSTWSDGSTVFRYDVGPGDWTLDALHSEEDGSVHDFFFRGAGPTSTISMTWRMADREGGEGYRTPILRIFSDKSVKISLTIQGGNATDPVSAYGGGRVGDYYLYNCWIDTLTITPGEGSGGAGSAPPGDIAYAEYTVIENGTMDASAITRHGVLENGVFYVPNVSDGNKGAITVSSGGTNWGINANAVALDNLQLASAKGQIIGRKSAGAGNYEVCTISDFTDIAVTVRDSDFSNSTGVSTAVSDMSFPIAANEKVLVVWEGIKVGSAAGAGIRAQITGPASPTFVRFSLEHYTSGSVVRTLSAVTAFGTDVFEVNGTTDELPFRMRAYIVNGANAGTVQLCIGSESAALGVTVTRGMSQIILDRS